MNANNREGRAEAADVYRVEGGVCEKTTKPGLFVT
jgi:hypothetical protein